jgi:hypothetical protein
MCSRPFETRSRFPLPRRYPRGPAAAGSLFPKAPFDLSVLPIYVARVPAAPFLGGLLTLVGLRRILRLTQLPLRRIAH